MIDKYGLSPWGKKQEWHPSFSSFDSHTPIALQKTYIFPHVINGMAVTMTANGISPKHVLVALNHGQVAVLDRAILDPRRPEAELTKTEKEVSVIQSQKYNQPHPPKTFLMLAANIIIPRYILLLLPTSNPLLLPCIMLSFMWVKPGEAYKVYAPPTSY